MSSSYVLSVSGAPCIEEAVSFFQNQAVIDLQRPIPSEFRRVLMCSPDLNDHIRERLKHMTVSSPFEVIWMGYDDESMTKSTYVLYCAMS